MQAISSSVSSIDLSNQYGSAACSTSVVETGILNSNACELTSNEVSRLNFQSLQHADETQNLPVDPSETCSKDAVLKDRTVNVEEHKLTLTASEVRRTKHSHGRNKLNQSGYAHQVPAVGPQFPQGINNSQGYLGMLDYSNSQFSPHAIQSSLPSTGLTAPYYAATTAFMNSGSPFYSNFTPSGFLSPRYSIGGYALGSSSVAPYNTGYSSQGDLLPSEAAGRPDLNDQATNASSGGNPHVSDFQSHGNLHGQYGLPVQHPYSNPSNMQYYSHTSSDVYPAAFQQTQFSSRTLTGGLSCHLPSHQDVPSYLSGNKFQYSAHDSLTIPSSKNMGISRSSCYGNTNMSIMMQFPPSSCGGPICSSSSMGKTNIQGGHNENVPCVSVRNAGFSSGHRGIRGFGVTKQQDFLEELKSKHPEKFKLSDVAGHIVEFRCF